MLSYCISPKLSEEQLCITQLLDEYNEEDSMSCMLLPKLNGLRGDPRTVGLNGVFTPERKRKKIKTIKNVYLPKKKTQDRQC